MNDLQGLSDLIASHGGCEEGDEWLFECETIADAYRRCPKANWLM